jgi:hypothetical protein
VAAFALEERHVDGGVAVDHEQIGAGSLGHHAEIALPAEQAKAAPCSAMAQ